MALIQWPAALKLREVSWRQDWPRLVQRSEFSGRTRIAMFGSSPRWTADCQLPAMSAEKIRLARGFFSRLAIPGNFTALAAVEQSQHGELESIMGAPGLPGAPAWALSNMLLRPASAATVNDWAPADNLIFTQQSFGLGSAQANGGAVVPLPAGTTLWVEAWGLIGSGTTGTASLRIEWRDVSAAVISTSTMAMDPGAAPFTTANLWARQAATYTPPVGAVSARVFFLAQMTAGSMYLAAPRASVRPARVTVNGGGQSGVSLSLSGLRPSAAHLRTGDMITVTLPGGTQMIPLAAPIPANGSGIGVASLTAPLRESPANAAKVEIAFPDVQLRAGPDILGWAAQPGGIYGAPGFTLEEAF